MIDYLEQVRSINGAYYEGKLRWSCQEITTKRQEKLTCDVLLLQDNAPAHMSQVAITVATECGFAIHLHPNIPMIWLLLTFICSQNNNTQYRSNEDVIEAVNEYLGGPGKGVLFRRDKKARTEMG